MSKKFSDVFNSIRYSKLQSRGKPHLSTDDEEHGTVGEVEWDQQLAHQKKRAMQEESVPYVAVHAKKGKHETHGSTSYEAAQNAAKHWKMKNTSGISVYRADKTHSTQHVGEEVEQIEEMPGANMDTRAVHKHLRKSGWLLTRTKGSHDVYTHPKSEKHIAVPRHKQLKAPLIRGIMKDAQVSEESVKGAGIRKAMAESEMDQEKTNTPAKRTLSKTTSIVKDAAKKAKNKKSSEETFQDEPELSTQIIRVNY